MFVIILFLRIFIVFQTDNASFINLPNHNLQIGFWLSNKFIYPSEKHPDKIAIGIIYHNIYGIVKYDENLKRHIGKKLTGNELIVIYENYK